MWHSFICVVSNCGFFSFNFNKLSFNDNYSRSFFKDFYWLIFLYKKITLIFFSLLSRQLHLTVWQQPAHKLQLQLFKLPQLQLHQSHHRACPLYIFIFYYYIFIFPNNKKGQCYKGKGTYLFPGCRSLYKCTAQIYTQQCPFGMIFDVNSKTWTSPTMAQCQPSFTYCPNGSGFYAYSGCNSFYFCQMTITKYSCSAGLIYNPSSAACVPRSSFHCPY